MQQVLRGRFSTLVVCLAIAVIFSSFTLIIITSWIRFFLFGFEILVIIVSFLLLTTKQSAHREKSNNSFSLRKLGSRFYFEAVPSLVLTVMGAVLLLLISYRVDGGIIQLLFAMASGCLLVGYATLNIIRVQKYFSKIEFYVVSFLTSIGITGFLTIGLNSIAYVEQGLSISFLLIGIISLLVTIITVGKKDGERQLRSLSRSIDALAISICIGFYLIFVVMVYPDAASTINSDISRHFAYSATLIRAPDLYSNPFYLLFHSLQGSIFLLAGGQPMILFISSFAFLNLFLPLSVYTAAKRILGTIDARIPGLAVIFYTFLSNLSFIYFATLHLAEPQTAANEYSLILREVAEKSYFGIINTLQPFNFLVPLTISIIGILIIVSLLRNASIPKYRYIGLLSFLVISLSLIHVPEIALLGLLISLYSILHSKTFIRSRESLIAMAIGFLVAAILFVILDISVFKREAIFVDKFILGAFLLPAFASIIALVWDYKKIRLKFMPSHYLRIHISNKLEGITLAILVMYIAGIILWFFIEDFRTSALIEIGVVPSFMFPVILGVVGLLAIFSIRNIKNQHYRGAVLFLLFAILFLFVTGKVLSFINVNYFQLPYWEKRMPGLIFLFASMLAPIAVTNLWDRIHEKRRNKYHLAFVSSTIIASVILIGFSSLATQLEYWYTVAKGDRHLDTYDIEAVEVLRRIIDEYPSSVTISPSDFSRYATTFTTSAYQLPRQNILFSSELPEVPLMILGGLPYDRIYVYIHTRDLDILNLYSNSWFSKHLLYSLPLLYENEEVKIYNATGLKFPQSRSETAVVIPNDAVSDNWLYAYNAVAKSSMNYTEILDQDKFSLGKYGNTIFTTDPSSSFSHYMDFTSKNVSQDFWKITGRWNQTDNGLHGFGNYSDAARNMNTLISDFTTDSNSMALSTIFKIDDKAINRKLTTHATLIHSWKNQTNFDMGGVAFRDDNIYAYFATVRNSKVTFYPQFPYSAPLITGLKWNGDSLVNMTTSKRGGVEDLYINGTKYLSRTIIDKSSGFVGISTSGANDIVFKRFDLSTKGNTPLPYDEYYDYVANGGNLTVYNTNGYGTIFSMLNRTIQSDYGRSIEEEDNIDKMDHGLSATEDVNYKDRKDAQTTRTGSSTYKNKADLPLTLEALSSNPNFTVINAKLEKGNIRYVDIYSLIKNETMSEKEKSFLLQNITNTILENDYEWTDFDYQKIPMIFQNMQAEGNIYMNTSFVAFPSDLNAKLVNMRGSETSQLPLGTNLTWLKLSEYNIASIHSDNITLPASGGGMYVDLVLGKNQIITLDFDRNTLVQAGTLNGSQINYKNVTSITFRSSHPIDIVTRTPVINLEGIVHFGTLHGGRLTGIAGEDGIFNGKISFAILASDTYTMADNVSFNGKFDTALIKKYDEFSALITSSFAFDTFSYPPVVIAILAILVALAAIFLLYKKIF